MARPRCDCTIGYCAKYHSFKPEGYVCDDSVDLSEEEVESLRLKNIQDMDQTTAAKKMGISQSTFQRILASAYKKVSHALIEGKELRIIKKI